MTFHLTDSEIVDALDGRLALPRQPHLQRCAECRAAVSEARTQLAALTADAESVPEPSPEFWTHFAASVHARVAETPVPRPSVWWQGSSAGWGLLAAAAALLLAVWLPGAEPTTVSDHTTEPGLIATVSIDDVRWQLMTDVLSDLPDEDVVAVLAPSAMAVDSSLDGLSAQERENFRRLLEDGLNQGSH